MPVLISLNPDSLTLYLTYCFQIDIKPFSKQPALQKDSREIHIVVLIKDCYDQDTSNIITD